MKVQEAYGQFMEYVTQDGDVRLFEPLRKPIKERSEALAKAFDRHRNQPIWTH